jgi:hypothetical protein
MKKILHKVVFAAMIVFSIANSNAQETPRIFGIPALVNPENGKIRCASFEYEQHLRATYGMESREQFESWITEKIEQQKAMRTTGTNTVLTIPVVVHVIHNGDAVGSNENIALAQVQSQIDVLNEDYRRMVDTPGWNDNPVGADTEIEFCLAKVDPDGNPTNGVDRVNLGQTNWGSASSDQTIDEIDSDVKPVTIWDPTKYMNIWTINYHPDCELLGYAQFPNTNVIGGIGVGNGPANTDGVVIGYRYFGSKSIYPQGNYEPTNTYVYGRTTTHEVGHFLGLLHIWGDNSSCSVNAEDSNKDYCPDTPASNVAHYICGTFNTCSSAPGNDMVENYMDYSNDACMNIFTQDQKERMVAVLNNAARRKSLTTSTVCQDPNASIEDFGTLNALYLYPNPAQTLINISGADGDLPDGFSIFNSLGQVITTVKVNGTADLTINTSAYANGVYLIKVDKGNGSKTFKFVKN